MSTTKTLKLTVASLSILLAASLLWSFMQGNNVSAQSGNRGGWGMHENETRKGKGDMITDHAEALGMTTTDLQTALDSGKTFQQIATEKGITAELLQQKLQAIHKTRLDAQVAAGTITQAQADEMLTRQPGPGRGFRPEGFGGRDEQLTAKASILGITVEELQSAFKEGKSTKDLLDAKGISLETFQAKMLELQKALLATQVENGTITQAQADQRLAGVTERQAGCITGDGISGGKGMGRGMGGGRGRIQGTATPTA